MARVLRAGPEAEAANSERSDPRGGSVLNSRIIVEIRRDGDSSVEMHVNLAIIGLRGRRELTQVSAAQPIAEWIVLKCLPIGCYRQRETVSLAVSKHDGDSAVIRLGLQAGRYHESQKQCQRDRSPLLDRSVLLRHHHTDGVGRYATDVAQDIDHFRNKAIKRYAHASPDVSDPIHHSHSLHVLFNKTNAAARATRHQSSLEIDQTDNNLKVVSDAVMYLLQECVSITQRSLRGSILNLKGNSLRCSFQG